MKKNKSNKFLLVTSILSMIILLIGTTFSYFTISTRSEYDAVQVEANKIRLALSISPVYTGHQLVPLNDEDIMTAYENKCVDIRNNGACLAYRIEVSNFHGTQDIIGSIKFKTEGINNLSYIVLDEEENEYLSKTSVGSVQEQKLPLGESFSLSNATDANPAIKKFIIIVWLTNLKDQDQTDMDAGGTFNASVTYESVTYGNKLTASVSGTEKNNAANEVA